MNAKALAFDFEELSKYIIPRLIIKKRNRKGVREY